MDFRDVLLADNGIIDGLLFIEQIANEVGLTYSHPQIQNDKGLTITIKQVVLSGNYHQIDAFYKAINPYRNIGLDWSVYNRGHWYQKGLTQHCVMWATNEINFPSKMMYFLIETIQ